MFKSQEAKKVVMMVVLAITMASCAMIEGRETPGQYVDDAAVTTRVKAAFVSDPVVEATQVSVETMQGVVQLSGFVDTPEEQSRAVEVASRVEGVRSVQDDIVVRTGKRYRK